VAPLTLTVAFSGPIPILPMALVTLPPLVIAGALIDLDRPIER